MRQYLRDTLDYESMVLRDFFDRDRLEATVALFLAGRNEPAHFVTSLLSLEVWLRGVLHGQHA